MALTKVTGQVIKNTTDVTVGVLTVTNTLAVGGTVSIGGTLTYEDVTNVDAVGLVTARNGIVVGSGITLSKDGDGFFTGVTTATTFSGAFSGSTGTFTGNVAVSGANITLQDSGGASDDRIQIGTSQDLELYHTGSHSFIEHSGTGHLILGGVPNGNNVDIMKAGYSEYMARFKPDSSVDLYWNGNVRLQTTPSGADVTGTLNVSGITTVGGDLAIGTTPETDGQAGSLYFKKW